MDHTHIIHPTDLQRYADTRDSQAVIPELIYLLVKASVSSLSLCRIPYGEAVNQPGRDGLVEAGEAFFEFVPIGRSYWEIGTNSNPQDKATEDFKKRTDELSEADRAAASFVFVTPRSNWTEPKQTKWLERRKDTGWKLIRIIDGVKLADWLREFPAIGLWMAKKIGLSTSLGGLSTPREHWDSICAEKASGDPPLPPKLFTEGRDNACNALQALFEGTQQRLPLFAESPQDVDDFVAAYIQTLGVDTARGYSDRCLYVREEDAWRNVVESRQSHVLVAAVRLALESEERSELLTLATRKGHAVVIPLCGAWSSESPEIVKLRSPSRHQIETVLRESGYSNARSGELASIGGDRISVLRRHLQGLGTLPSYATWENARLIAQAGLAGKWDGTSPADRSALEKLLGKGYGEWIETLRPDVLRSDTPLIQRDEKWRMVARGEAWNALGNRIIDEDLERLREVAVSVLGERDPKFDLPKEERFLANVRGKQLKHSSRLREGLAETLALVGSRPEALSSCSFGKAETTAILVVRQLLHQASWERWASLDSLLPLLAEAAPGEFLDAVEAALVNLNQSPFHDVFSQEGNGRIADWNYMSGLLWALETLAWNPDYLSRVAVILADLGSIDPGGNWANRPANSLVGIFLPWHVQTTASFDKRKTAIETVLHEQPHVGWKLLLALLPHEHGLVMEGPRPTWRDYIPRDWKDSVLVTEYWDQVTAYTDLAVGLAKESPEKLGELVDHLPEISEPARASVLKHLASEQIVNLSESERFPLWEKISDLVRHHRKFSDAAWALPTETLAEIEEAANALAPETFELRKQHLFSGRVFDLYDREGDWEAQRKRLDEARQLVVGTILERGDLQAVLTFSRTVAKPETVGAALGIIASEPLEANILPSLLNAEEDAIKKVISAFVWERRWELGWTWVDDVLRRDWNTVQKAAFLVLLPFEEEVWNRVSEELGEQNEELYWRDVPVNPYGPDRDLTVAVEKLLEYQRVDAALSCVSRTTYESNPFFDENLATRTLLAVLEEPPVVEKLDRDSTVKVITRLQQSSEANQDALFKIEWNFLPWLDRFSPGSPVTLEKRLASDPRFFAELVSLVFRSKNDTQEDGELDDQKKNLARNAYKLLTEWRRCPGTLVDDSFNAEAFKNWLDEAKRITEETGHGDVAQRRIGDVLIHAPPDPNGLWIHESVASALNSRGSGEMRFAFTIELRNQRGVHTFTAGKEERELAQTNRDKAEALETRGYSRFATAMREVAEQYEREAERAAERAPFDD